MKWFERLDRWHQTKKGLATFGVVEAALAYLFLIWAIDKGSLLDWLLAVIFTIGAIQNIGKLVVKLVRERRGKES